MEGGGGRNEKEHSIGDINVFIELLFDQCYSEVLFHLQCHHI